MTLAAIRKYGAFCRVAAAQARRERGEMYGRMAFFVVLLGVFSRLWNIVGAADRSITIDPKAMLWYLAVTEWIAISAPFLHVDIQEAIRRGDVACQLGRPVSYVGATLAEGLGRVAVRAPLLGATALIWTSVLTHSIPPLRVLLVVVPLGLAATALLTAMSLGIGLLAFWIEDVTPVAWVWQKLLFVLGGLMLPLQVYPDALRRVALLTPFPAMLTGPASFMLPENGFRVVTLVRDLTIWSGVMAFVLWWIFRRAVRTLTFNGG